MISISEFAAIDPLALLLPSSVYVRIIEKIHPHVPKVAEMQETLKAMNAEEKAFVLGRVRAMGEFSKAVEEAMR
jgi:hypothetical protein